MNSSKNTLLDGKLQWTTVTYAVGLLLFLLPFFTIRCNGLTVAQVSGINMATGRAPGIGSDLEKLGKGLDRSFGGGSSVKATEKGDGRLFITALAALLLGAAGLVLSLTRKEDGNKANMIVAILACVALIGSWLELSATIRSETKTTVASDNSFPGAVEISASPTVWFAFSLLCFAASALLCYQQQRQMSLAALKGAPQVHINNPGEQSEFPAAPTDEQGLG